MPKVILLYTTSAFLVWAGMLFIKSSLKKPDAQSAMRFVHYRPIKNYGKGVLIALGIFYLLLGLLLLSISPK